MMCSFFSDSVQAIQHYHQQGFFIEPDLFTAEQCDEIKARAHLLTSAKGQQFSPVMMPHREDTFFLEPMKNSRLIQMMSAFLDGEVSGLQSQFFYMKPGTRGFTAHQDNYFVQAKNDAFASAWLALEDTSVENGGLIVYPGSHAQGLLPVEETNIVSATEQDPNAYRMEVVIPAQYQPLDVTVKKGSVLFIHGCVVHASHTNRSESQWRHVLLNTYIRTGESFRPGRDAKRVEIPLN